MGYESHVKYWFRTEGCPEDEYNTPFLRQLRSGIQKTLPSNADTRRALLLPNFMNSNQFNTTIREKDILVRFATILGFVGMLRPHTFEQLGPNSFTIVLMSHRCVRLGGPAKVFRSQLDQLRRSSRILGFYIDFESKTMQNARAYFPSLCSRKSSTPFAPMCPVRALVQISSRGKMRKAFLKSINKGKLSTKYLNRVSETTEAFALYSLRIGGRTWMLSEGMDRQFCDFLGTWKSPDASARYFRANPAAVLKLLRNFYGKIDMKENNKEEGKMR